MRRTSRGASAGLLLGAFDAVDDGAALLEAVLDARQPLVDPAPPRRDEIDEQREIVDAGVPLGEHVALEPLEPADELVHEAAHLGEVAGDREHLLAHALLHRVADAGGEARFELCSGCGERLDLLARPLERRVHRGRLDAALGGAGDTLQRALDDCLLHPRGRYTPGRTEARSGHVRVPGTGTWLRRTGPVGTAHGAGGPPGGRDTSWCQAPDVTRDTVTPMEVSELDYELPAELIAQHPAVRRDGSRLLVYERTTGAVRHRRFAELPEELQGELVVVNDTKVVPARIPIASPRGEVLLLERIGGDVWEGLARPTRRLQPGRSYGPVELLEHLGEGRWRLRLEGEPCGETPLPPYITEPLADPGRYQTVYAREAGSAAAPTAGLHFTHELLARLEVEQVTLHVGLDTFRPIGEERLEEHRMHGERYCVTARAWERIRNAGRVLAVGTTTVRVLETLARGGPLAGRTSLFVTPGFDFRRVDALVTNFHLPRSTLLALVMAFAGVEETRRLYRLAVDERYRFYSFGDAMLIL